MREEDYVHLMLRVERAFKINSWSENPPARTRRLVGNLEAMAHDGDQWQVLSNFHLFYARPGLASCLYSGQRRDTLVAVEEGFHVMLVEMDDKGNHQLKLIPNPPWAEIQHIMLSVSQEDYTIRKVETHNQIGGITRFILGDLSVKEKFPEGFFRFVVPEGVKIIQQDG